MAEQRWLTLSAGLADLEKFAVPDPKPCPLCWAGYPYSLSPKRRPATAYAVPFSGRFD